MRDLKKLAPTYFAALAMVTKTTNKTISTTVNSPASVTIGI